VGSAERSAASAKGNTLAEIASATGGTNFHDNNNLLTGLQRAFADGRDYYTLAYVSSNESLDGKFRAIKVQVRNRKVNIGAKRGYWAATAQ
jgi:VWFA-related protein